MSTKHRNAGGPFVIYDPGIGVSGSLSVDGTVQGTNDGLQINSDLHVTGTISASTSLTGDLTGNVTGDLTGNADTATSATKISIVTNDADAPFLIPFVGGSGDQIPYGDLGLQYNPSSNTLTADNFSGDLTGDVTGDVTGDLTGNVTGNVTGNADTATAASSVVVSADYDSPGSQYILFSDAGDGTNGRTVRYDDGFRYNPSTNVLTVSEIDLGDVTVDNVLNEEDMSSNSATALATQASIKAYVDNEISSIPSASSATNVAVTNDTTTNSTHYVAFVGAVSGNAAINVDSGGMTYNPSSNLLSLGRLVINSTNTSNLVTIADNGNFPSEPSKINIRQASDNNAGGAIHIENSGGTGSVILHYNTASGGYLGVRFDGGTTGLLLQKTGGVATASFTGQHRNVPEVPGLENKVGYIVIATGTYNNFQTGGNADDEVYKPNISHSLPVVRLSSERNQKSVFGVIESIEEAGTERKMATGQVTHVFEKELGDERLIINSLGEGGIWICNINGNLENGDYITSCEVPGLGMKQDDDLLHNYTVAKITCDCNFDLDSIIYDCEEFEFNGSTYKKAFVGCTYHCG